MDIDIDAVWTTLESIRGRHDDPDRTLGAVIDVCERSKRSRGWARLRRIDYGASVDHVARWFQQVLREDPPSRGVNGLNLGLFNPEYERGRPTADLHLMGSSAYAGDDPTFPWLESLTWRPERRAGAGALAELYTLAHERPGRLGNEAEWSLGLAFGVVCASRVLHDLVGALPDGMAPPVGVAAGFDSGDCLLVGEATTGGAAAPPSPGGRP